MISEVCRYSVRDYNNLLDFFLMTQDKSGDLRSRVKLLGDMKV